MTTSASTPSSTTSSFAPLSQEQAFDQSFEQSQRLRQQWILLRDQFQAIDGHDTHQQLHRQQLSQQMHQIKTEMTRVLSQTRRLLPSTSTQADRNKSYPNIENYDHQQSLSHLSIVQNLSTLEHATERSSTPPTMISDNAHYNPVEVDQQIIEKRPQYSARRKHVVRRTYDSTSSSSDDSEFRARLAHNFRPLPQHHSSTFSSDPSDAAKVPRPNLANFTRAFRSRIKPSTTPFSDTPSSVPPSSASITATESVASDAPGTTTSKTIPVEDFGFGTPSTAPSAPTPPGSIPDDNHDSALTDLSIPISTSMTDDQRKVLTLEQSQLERESRRLKRKPDRTRLDETRLLDIASRLSKLSSTLAETGDMSESSLRARNLFSPRVPPAFQLSRMEKDRETLVKSANGVTGKQMGNTINPSRRGSNSVFGLKTGRAQAVLSPITVDGEDDVGVDGTEEETSPATGLGARGVTPSSTKAVSKRKKTWMALEAGMAPFKALGRSVRNTALPPTMTPKAGRRGATSGISLSNSFRADDTGTRRKGAGGSAFTDVAERLDDRAVKLNQAVEASDRMTTDASDMLAAARALRQRQQKGMRP